MPRISAGLLMYRVVNGQLELLLVHPGGPFFRRKDAGAWTIPKGEIERDEDGLQAACREFTEETGLQASGPFRELTPIKQKSGKVVLAWAFEGDCDPSSIVSNTCTIQWPPNSGQQLEFPEIDLAGFFAVEEARRKIHPAQAAWLDEVQTIVKRC